MKASRRVADRVSRLLRNYERSTKSHEAARKELFVRVVSCSFVDRLILPENRPPLFHQGTEDGLPRDSAVRFDFLTLMFKKKLTHFVGALSADKLKQLNHALQYALDLKD